MTTKLCLQNSHVELLMITIHFIIVCVLCSYIDIHCNISPLINLWKFYRRHGVIEQFLCGRVLVWFCNMAHCHLWGAWLMAQCPKKSQAFGLHSGLSFLMGYRVANKCESIGAWRVLFLLLKVLLEQQYLFLCLLTITGNRNFSYRGSETNCQLVWWHCPPLKSRWSLWSWIVWVVKESIKGIVFLAAINHSLEPNLSNGAEFTWCRSYYWMMKA